jgi:hypothetical protein
MTTVVSEVICTEVLVLTMGEVGVLNRKKKKKKKKKPHVYILILSIQVAQEAFCALGLQPDVFFAKKSDQVPTHIHYAALHTVYIA